MSIFGTDKRDTAGMSPAELADEMEWRALEAAANAEADTAYRGTTYTWPESQRPGYKATPALDKITPAERKELDARPLLFTGKYPDKLPHPREVSYDWRSLTKSQWAKASKAAQREHSLSRTGAECAA